MPNSQLQLRFDEIEQPLQRQAKEAGVRSAEMVNLSSTLPYDFEVRGEAHYLCFHDLILEDGEIAVGGGSKIEGRDIRRTFTFLPRGVLAKGWARPADRRNGFVALHIAPDAVPPALRPHLEQPEVYFRDAQLEHTFRKLAGSLANQAPNIELLTDTIIDLGIAEFAFRRAAPIERPTRGLGPRELQRLQEYIDANLAQPISLDDLAAVSGLSKFHFSRAYKAATGRSPYRAVLEARASRAVDLARAGAPVAVVATQLGFESRAQLTRTVRDVLGISLGAVATDAQNR